MKSKNIFMQETNMIIPAAFFLSRNVKKKLKALSTL